MKRTLVIYTNKLEHAEENARLIGSVFDELQAHAPEGLRYMVLRYGEGRFVHLVEQRDGAPSLSDFEAFSAFSEECRRTMARPARGE